MLNTGKIIDDTGFIVETVAYDESTNDIYHYELSENEKLIKEPLDKFFVKPKWDNEKWIEGATDDEVTEYSNKQKEEQSLKTDVSEIDELKSYILDMEYRNMVGGLE